MTEPRYRSEFQADTSANGMGLQVTTPGAGEEGMILDTGIEPVALHDCPAVGWRGQGLRGLQPLEEEAISVVGAVH